MVFKKFIVRDIYHLTSRFCRLSQAQPLLRLPLLSQSLDVLEFHIDILLVNNISSVQNISQRKRIQQRINSNEKHYCNLYKLFIYNTTFLLSCSMPLTTFHLTRVVSVIVQVNLSYCRCQSLYIYHYGDTTHRLIFNWYVCD